MGVDYALLYIRRAGEEREAGKNSEAALAPASTSRRAVLTSGVTVMTAMAGLYLSGAQTFSGSPSTIAVVAVSVLGSITVLPAALSVLGDRVDEGLAPAWPAQALCREFGLWSRSSTRVTRRPCCQQSGLRRAAAGAGR